MKKILFDGTSMQKSPWAKFHGGGEYAKIIMREALKHNYKFDIVFDSRRETPADVQKIVTTKALQVHSIDSKEGLYALIDNEGYDAFYAALPYDYTDYPCKAQFIGTIHGLRNIELPYTWERARMEPKPHKKLVFCMAAICKPLAKMLRNRHIAKMRSILSIKGAKFIVVSNTTKSSIKYFFPDLDADVLKVGYSPFDLGSPEMQEVKSDYYMMVSANRFEKNVPLAIKAFDTLFSKGLLPGKRVAITGCDAGAFYTKVKNPDRFDFLPYLSHEDLLRLYRNAFCMVYPSINEGFGYPPIMAMGFRVPVIASSSTSMSEVLAGGALYFAPTSAEDLCNRILQIELDADSRKALIERGYDRAQWLKETVAKQMSPVLDYIFT